MRAFGLALLIFSLCLLFPNFLLADTISGGISYSGGAVGNSSFNIASVEEFYEVVPLAGGGLSLQSGFRGTIWPGLATIVIGVTPASGYNIAPLNRVKVNGANFTGNTTVRLTRTGQNNVSGSSITLVSSTEITCNFNIAGAQVGYWNVVVDDGSNNLGSLTNGFEVKTYPYDMAWAINSPNPFDPARESTTIMYKLKKDSEVTVLIFSVTADLLWKSSYPAGFNGGREGDNSLLWTGYTNFGELASNGVFLVHVVEKASGKTLARGKIAVIRR
jgi:hypothetical protein